MDNSDKKLAIWKDAVKRMNEEDLAFILDFPECFEPQILKLVKSRQKEIAQPLDEEFENVEDTTIEAKVYRALHEMGCNFDIDEDREVNFKYQNEEFSIIFHEDRPFITIFKYNLLTIDLDNYHEVSKMYSAINATNTNGHIIVTYHISKEDNKVYVHSHTTTLFDTFIPNCVGYLDLMLTYFLHTRRFLKDKMAEIYETDSPNSRLN